MSKTVLYGVSDDLLEIEGPLNYEEGLPHDEAAHVQFSDGTSVTLEYDPKMDPHYGRQWRIEVWKCGSLFEGLTKSSGADSADYTDTLILSEGITSARITVGMSSKLVEVKNA